MEYITTLEPYTYGSNVKCTIPTLLPMLDKSNVVEEKNKVFDFNLMNKDKSLVKLDRYTSSNYINVYIPKKLAPIKFCKDSKSFSKISDCNCTPCTCGLDLNGKKGDKFVVMFVGGDIKNIRVIERLEF